MRSEGLPQRPATQSPQPPLHSGTCTDRPPGPFLSLLLTLAPCPYPCCIPAPSLPLPALVASRAPSLYLPLPALLTAPHHGPPSAPGSLTITTRHQSTFSVYMGPRSSVHLSMVRWCLCQGPGEVCAHHASSGGVHAGLAGRAQHASHACGPRAVQPKGGDSSFAGLAFSGAAVICEWLPLPLSAPLHGHPLPCRPLVSSARITHLLDATSLACPRIRCSLGGEGMRSSRAVRRHQAATTDSTQSPTAAVSTRAGCPRSTSLSASMASNLESVSSHPFDVISRLGKADLQMRGSSQPRHGAGATLQAGQGSSLAMSQQVYDPGLPVAVHDVGGGGHFLKMPPN